MRVDHTMTPYEIKKARQSLGLTQLQFGAVLETTGVNACLFETDPSVKSHRPLPVRAEQLIKAWMAGYRPPDWPVRE